MKQVVEVLTTGGTIEKTYNEFDGSIGNRESQLRKRLLSKLRLHHTDIAVHEIMAKDSLYMNDDDREDIYIGVMKSAENGHPIVVLHGTDTMDKTLTYCYAKNPNPRVPVVFTGAMRPAGFEDSDALQNFTEALYASQVMPAGYYLSFHGRLFPAPEIRKNRDRLTFETL